MVANIVITVYLYEAIAETSEVGIIMEKGPRNWYHYYELMKNNAPLTIYYPICGGGEECISVCLYGHEIWEVVQMITPMFGGKPRARLRPFMAHPEKCRQCYLCVQACPTGALHRSDQEIRHPIFTLIKNSVKLFFKKRYGVKWVFRREHREKFRKNNPK